MATAVEPVFSKSYSFPLKVFKDIDANILKEKVVFKSSALHCN